MNFFLEHFVYFLFMHQTFGYFLDSSKCKIALPNNQKVDLAPLDNPNDPMYV